MIFTGQRKNGENDVLCNASCGKKIISQNHLHADFFPQLIALYRTMIDDPEQVKILMEKMKANLPIKVQGTKELTRSLKLSNQSIQIESLLYMADEGGIVCALKIQGQESIASIVSLTHLRIADAHPLAKDIRRYQTLRTKKLQR